MILIEDLCYARSNQIIFQNFSLRINPGDKLLLTGKSGSGKTSLLKLLLGFERPDGGRITINGLPIDKKNIKTIRSSVFYLSQDVDFPDEHASDILTKGFQTNQITRPSRNQLDHYLQRLSLPDTVLDKKVTQLSGGERQRLGLLFCFLLNRAIWLLDEPTSALDRQTKREIANDVTRADKTILIISHDPEWLDQPGISLKEMV